MGGEEMIPILIITTVIAGCIIVDRKQKNEQLKAINEEITSHKAKQEFIQKIQRKINRCIEVNLHAIDERLSGNEKFANDLSKIGEEEHEEIKDLMKQLDQL